MPTTPTLETVDDLVAELGCASPVFVPARDLPARLVRQALEAGVISEWEDSPVGRAVLLSSLTTSRLGLELSDGEIERSSWVRRGMAPAIISKGVAEVPEGASTAPGPLDLLIAHEDAMRALDRPGPDHGRGRAAALGFTRPLPPLPTIVIGSTLPDWRPAIDRIDDPAVPVAPRAAGEPCPVCRGRRFSRLEVCLSCLRSGIDDRLPKIEDHEKPRPKRARVAAISGAGDGRGGRGKAKGKARRAG